MLWALAAVCCAQTLPVKWEELTAEDFQSALKQSQGTCLLPFGIIEKHGPQLPLGTDLINVRYVSEHAAAEDYAIVFPLISMARFSKPNTSPARWRTALNCSSNCCRKPPTKWRAAAARRS